MYRIALEYYSFLGERPGKPDERARRSPKKAVSQVYKDIESDNRLVRFSPTHHHRTWTDSFCTEPCIAQQFTSEANCESLSRVVPFSLSPIPVHCATLAAKSQILSLLHNLRNGFIFRDHKRHDDFFSVDRLALRFASPGKFYSTSNVGGGRAPALHVEPCVLLNKLTARQCPT